MRALCLRQLETVQDPVLRQKLTPDFEVGCRRLIFSDLFYDAIQKPNVALVTDAIERVEPQGIRTHDGTLHELDVLVTATGFYALDYARNLVITGDRGQSLGDVWEGGAKALRSMAVTGFPNHFMLIGPHSPVGNFSLTGISEIQMNYIMGFIQMLLKGNASAIDPRPEAQARYNDRLREGLQNTVGMSGCTSWYLDKNGLPRLYPFTPQVYRRDMKQPDLTEYRIVAAH